MVINSIYLFIGTPEILMVLIAVLLLFGSKRIPGFARSLAKGIQQVRHAADEIKHDITESVDEVKEEINSKGKLDD